MDAGGAGIRSPDRPLRVDLASELERFAWAAPDRLDVVGRFAGLRQGRHSSPARVWVLGLLACLMLAPATPAAERQRESPSARELWRDYPLEQDGADAELRAPERGEAASPARTARTAATPPPAAPERTGGGGSPAPLLAGIGAALAAIGLGAVWARRRPSGAVADGGPAVEPSPAPPSPTRSAPLSLVSPPDPERAWSAEVMWDEGAGESRFCVVARAADGRGETIVGESAAFRWPPASQDDVEAVSRAADEVSASLMRAGWHPIAPGRAWYAKRFAWSPAGRPVADESRRNRSGRFAGGTDASPVSPKNGDSIRTAAGGPS